MPPRPFSTDVPSIRPRRRNGILKARLSAHLYQVDFGLGSEWAYYPGDDLLDLGAERSCVWDAVTNQWWIRPLPSGGWFVWGGGNGDTMPWAAVLASGTTGPSDVQIPQPTIDDIGLVINLGDGCLAFSRDGAYFAATGEWWDQIQDLVVWPVTGTRSFGDAIVNSSTTLKARSMDWAWGGRFIALQRNPFGGNQDVAVVEFVNGAFVGSPVTGPSGYAPTRNANAVAWSPDDAYIAIADDRPSYGLSVYPWDSGSLTFGTRVTDPTTAIDVEGSLGLGKSFVRNHHVAWRPQGDVIAILVESTPKAPSDPHESVCRVHAYEWTGSGFGVKLPNMPEEESLQSAGGSGGRSMVWTPDGRFLVATDDSTGTPGGIGTEDSNGRMSNIMVYEYIDTLTKLTLRSYVRANYPAFFYGDEDYITEVALSPLINGRYYICVSLSWNHHRFTNSFGPDYENNGGPNGYEVYELDPTTGALSDAYPNTALITSSPVAWEDSPFSAGPVHWYPV